MLGPTLFIVYINDSADSVPRSVKKMTYADDTKFYSSLARFSPNTGELPQTLQQNAAWSQTWQLNLQAQKCVVLHLGYGNAKNMYSIGENRLESCDHMRDLGVIISSDLTFSQHCSVISKRAFVKSSLIFRCFLNSNSEHLLRCYKVYVRPLVESTCEVWNPFYRKDINLLESVQRRFTARLCKLCNIQYDSYRDRLIILNLDTLEHRRKVFDLILMYKVINNLVCLDTEMFSFSTLRENRAILPKARVELVRNSFVHRTSRVFNLLPDTIKNANTVTEFKLKLKTVRLNCCLDECVCCQA